MDRTRSTNALLAAAAFVVVVAGVKAAEAIMVPFLLAVFIATTAATPVFWLHRRGVPFALAIAAVALALVVALVGVGALVADAARGFLAQTPFYQERLVELARGTLEAVGSLGIDLSGTPVLQTFDPAAVFAMAGNTLPNPS
ncbi:MAG: AI-2E family transporter, partial [Gammaproteobacteria bacterium]|nr:AI-2E family transporter [Gammaproteobacteria bacterium]